VSRVNVSHGRPAVILENAGRTRSADARCRETRTRLGRSDGISTSPSLANTRGAGAQALPDDASQRLRRRLTINLIIFADMPAGTFDVQHEGEP